MIQSIPVREVESAIYYFESISIGTKMRWALDDICPYSIAIEMNDLLREKKWLSEPSEIDKIDEALKQIWRREFLEYVGGRLGLL